MIYPMTYKQELVFGIEDESMPVNIKIGEIDLDLFEVQGYYETGDNGLSQTAVILRSGIMISVLSTIEEFRRDMEDMNKVIKRM